jgi:hypothetical protein
LGVALPIVGGTSAIAWVTLFEVGEVGASPTAFPAVTVKE